MAAGCESLVPLKSHRLCCVTEKLVMIGDQCRLSG